MTIVFIGAGRLATNLAPALHDAGYDVVQVYSRTMEAAKQLADRVSALATNNVDEVKTDADVYIFSVTDTALPQLVAKLGNGIKKTVFLHTAGSVPMTVFEGYANDYGVFYPMQTFSKERSVDFHLIPVFIEGNTGKALNVARQLAEAVSNNVKELSSEGRRHLHLAAVFASNFANHCYAISEELLRPYGIDFDVMLPLVDEVAGKVHQLSPREAQTGPAVRYDKTVLEAQMQLLADKPLFHDIYALMSKSIHELDKGK